MASLNTSVASQDAQRPGCRAYVSLVSVYVFAGRLVTTHSLVSHLLPLRRSSTAGEGERTTGPDSSTQPACGQGPGGDEAKSHLHLQASG